MTFEGFGEIVRPSPNRTEGVVGFEATAAAAARMFTRGAGSSSSPVPSERVPFRISCFDEFDRTMEERLRLDDGGTTVDAFADFRRIFAKRSGRSRWKAAF